MAMGNNTIVTEFILLGLTNQTELQIPLFILFLGIYLVSMVGNLGLILLIWVSSQLHTPMYYFLSNLSFIDLCYSSVITPKMVENFVSEKSIISYPGCMAQFFFFLFFVIAEVYMLTTMAYDRYVAICRPLFYNVIMVPWFCSLLVAGVYTMGGIGAIAHTSYLARLSFCGDNVIHHYFCDVLPLLKLSCSSTHINELLVMIVGGFNLLVTTLLIWMSYTFILLSILRIQSTKGRYKAFSTCGSHLAAVSVFYGSIIIMYYTPASKSVAQEKVASVFYTTVIPMLNPLIYSLRNKDVMDAVKKIIKSRMFQGPHRK
ncbi:olfactory receptor 8D1-like [Dromiciops gliroides]|uniref:olfactory receptor 8D1-like n=1 Tax=Dromiciops gliroides TaxID=33562 RepID=UPI001CC76B45|nr:olfactory receptor 8D1-like [Dromiciops gliroides]